MLQVGFIHHPSHPYQIPEMLSDLILTAGAGGGWAGAGCPRPSHLQEEETPPRLRAQETPRQVGTHALVVLLLMLNVLILLFSQEVPPPRPPAHLRVLWAQLWAGVWEGVRSLRGDNDGNDDDDDNNDDDPRTRRLSWPRTVAGSHSTPAPGSEVSTSPPPSASPGWDTSPTRVS